jgi:acyl carrier protein
MDVDALTRQVCEMAATVFDLPPEQVTPDSSTETIEQWDSLGRLVLVLELEQTFGIELPPEVAQQLTSVRSVVAALVERGVTGEAVAR